MELAERIGRYRLSGVLGRGGMGTVYRARDETMDRDVALKLLTADSDAKAVGRFLREARAAAALQHPNIITVYELGEHDGQPFIAMELLEGLDLQRALAGPLPRDPQLALTLIRHVLAGLGHAHDHGVVHRDVKPSNVFVPHYGLPKLLDFGLARRGAHTTAASGGFAGTPHYLSPEQVLDEQLDGRSDLFSTGLVLYELLTGERAFTADSLVALVFRIAHESPDLEALPSGTSWESVRRLLERALARKREERYPDAAAFGRDVEAALRGFGGPREWTPPRADPARSPLPGPAPAPPPAAASTGAPPRSRLGLYILLAAGLAAAVAALALAGMLWLLLRSPGAAPPAPAPSPPAVTAPTAAATATAGASPAAPAAGQEAPKPRRTSPAPARSVPPSGRPPAPAPGGAATSTGAASPAPREEPIETLLARGEQAFARRHYASAREAARQALRLDPASPDARTLLEDAELALAVEEHLQKARAALARGDREAARAEVRAGLALAPDDGRLTALDRELAGAGRR